MAAPDDRPEIAKLADDITIPTALLTQVQRLLCSPQHKVKHITVTQKLSLKRFNILSVVDLHNVIYDPAGSRREIGRHY